MENENGTEYIKIDDDNDNCCYSLQRLIDECIFLFCSF